MQIIESQEQIEQSKASYTLEFLDRNGDLKIFFFDAAGCYIAEEIYDECDEGVSDLSYLGYSEANFCEIIQNDVDGIRTQIKAQVRNDTCAFYETIENLEIVAIQEAIYQLISKTKVLH